VVLDRAAHGLPPEFAPALRGQVARIRARIDERAQLVHGVGRVLVGAEEFLAQQALAPVLAAAGLLLLHAVADVRARRAEALLLKEHLLDRILNRLDVDLGPAELFHARADLFGHAPRGGV